MISKPQPNEHPPHAAGYIALVAACNDIVQLLAEQMERTAALFNSLPADKLDYSYAPGKWTIKEVLNHMIDTERVFAYRAMCFARGEQQNLPGFEQNDYVEHSEAGARTITDLIAEYQAVRLANLYFFKSLSTAQARRAGLSNGSPTTPAALAFMIAGHEQHHLNILQERYL